MPKIVMRAAQFTDDQECLVAPIPAEVVDARWKAHDLLRRAALGRNLPEVRLWTVVSALLPRRVHGLRIGNPAAIRRKSIPPPRRRHRHGREGAALEIEPRQA